MDILDSIPLINSIKYFVISGGKTGSTTLHRSIKHSFHSHGDHSIWHRYPQLKQHGIKMIDFVLHTKNRLKKKPLVVSSFREPISRTISSYFNNHVSPNDKNVNALIQRFITNEFISLENYYPMLDTDIFGKLPDTFPADKGYLYYETEHTRVLLLRFDFINQWPNIIPQFLDHPSEFTFTPDNVSSKKWYSNLYTQFKLKLRIPRDLLDYKFRSAEFLCTYFYTQEEYEKIKEFWYKQSDNNILPSNFNWTTYLQLNPDLPFKDECNAIIHWLNHGQHEKRKYLT